MISIEPQDLALAIAAHPDRKVFDSAVHQPSFLTHNPQESQRRPPTLPSVSGGGPLRRHQSRTAPRPKSPPPTKLNPSSRPVSPRCCSSCPFWKSWACGGQSTWLPWRACANRRVIAKSRRLSRRASLSSSGLSSSRNRRVCNFFM